MSTALKDRGPFAYTCHVCKVEFYDGRVRRQDTCKAEFCQREDRVKRLEDALTALYDDCCKGGFYITQKVEAVVDKALAAKEPKA